jgi:hypothetical protein
MLQFAFRSRGLFHIAQEARVREVNARSLPGIEKVNDDRYRQYGQGPEEGWIQERHVDKTKEKWISKRCKLHKA